MHYIILEKLELNQILTRFLLESVFKTIQDLYTKYQTFSFNHLEKETTASYQPTLRYLICRPSC